ncbi:hypothetical protein [Paracoccus sp. ME4]|uniref:hypothetical protein n=1 Tax=Paracoccus sp. ME4 TaxID=3138066 RepID=UPI00398B15D8
MSFLLPIALLSACLWTILARIGVRRASEGEDHIRTGPLFTAALTGGLAGMLAGTQDPATSAVTVILCAGLMAGALVDRETGWAPDAIVFPIVLLAMTLGALEGAWELSPVRAVIYAAIGYWLLQGLWLLAAWKITDFSPPPPADLIAVFLPMMFFGTDLRFSATMFAMAAALLLARRFSTVYGLFSRTDLIMRIVKKEDMRYPEGRHGITLLALAFPVSALSLIISRMV